MRAKHTALILTAGFLLIPTITLSQGPGGRPGGDFGGRPGGGGERGGWSGQPGGGFNPGGGAPSGGGGMRGGRMFADPDALFEQYSKDGRTLRKEDLPESMQRMIQFAGPMLGLTGDSWTRDQLKATAERVRTQFGQLTQGGGGPPGMGGPGGGDSDRRLDEAFKRMDRNEDGVLDNNEMSETLRTERDRYDPDHNGFIDLNEFRKYVDARRGDNESDRDRDRNADGPRRPRGDEGPEAAREEERKRPTTVVRAGNLPRDFPYAMMDKDTDGQIGLYEWKEYGRPISQFLTMDLNNDGFMTVDEYFRFKKQGEEQAAKAAGTSPSRFGGMMGGMNPAMLAMNPGMMPGGPGGNRWGGNGGGFGGITGIGMMPQGQWNPGGGPPMGMSFPMSGDRNSGGGSRGPGGPGGYGMPGGGMMPGGYGMTGSGPRGAMEINLGGGGGSRGPGSPGGYGMTGGGMVPGGYGMTGGGGGSGMYPRGDRGPGGPSGYGGDRGPRGMNGPGSDRGPGAERGPGGDRGNGGDRGPGGERGPGGRNRPGVSGENDGGQGSGDRGPGGPGGRRRPGG